MSGYLGIAYRARWRRALFRMARDLKGLNEEEEDWEKAVPVRELELDSEMRV